MKTTPTTFDAIVNQQLDKQNISLDDIKSIISKFLSNWYYHLPN